MTHDICDTEKMWQVTDIFWLLISNLKHDHFIKKAFDLNRINNTIWFEWITCEYAGKELDTPKNDTLLD